MELAAPTREAMWQAARRFEAQALGALMQPAFATLAAGPFGGGAAEAQWRPMLVDHYAQSWARRGGVGLASAVFNEMLRMQGQDGGVPRKAGGLAG